LEVRTLRARAALGVAVVGISFHLIAVATAYAQDADPDSKTKEPFSELNVTPSRVKFGEVNFSNGVTSESKSFKVTDRGTASLSVTVGNPSSSAFAITQGLGVTVLQPKGELTVMVKFEPSVAGKFAGTIAVSSEATKGKASASVKLAGKAKGALSPTPTPTATATPTATTTATATPTATATVTSLIFSANEAVDSVTEYPLSANGDATPSVDISGANPLLVSPIAIAIEAKGNIYVLNQFGGLSGNGSVTVYPAGSNLNASPTETIAGPDTQLSPPGGIAVDAAENIYVANQAGSTITEYPAGSNGDTTPIATIVGCASDNTEFACNPNGIAVDQVSGNIFVLNSGAGNPNIAEYAAGISGSNPATAIGLIQGSNTALNNVVASQGIALNPVNGDIYVSNLLGDNVLVYAAGIYGNVSPIAVIGGPDTFPGEGGVSPTGIASDSSGNIYVMNDNPPGITVYPAGSNGNVTPSTMIVGISNLFDGPGIAVGP
jgi:hypothetical protein